jgi:hypothetical protein
MGLQLLNERNGNIEDNFKIIFGDTFFVREYDKYKGSTDLYYNRKLMMEDVFYNDEKMSSSSIEL